MSILIIGSGMAGLATAVHTKELLPEEQVVVVESTKQIGNTLIAGQRLRRKKLRDLLGNPEDHNLQKESFIQNADKVLDFWQSILGSTEATSWFGPQLAGGRGIIALQEMRRKAEILGVSFMTGEARKLIRSNNVINGIIVQNKNELNTVITDTYVLANGGSVGDLFESTNIPIIHNAHELAFDASILLVGGTIHMFHPFGKSMESGLTIAGCFATDDLANVEVTFTDGTIDRETMELLSRHEAHEKFDEICSRFIEKSNGVVRLCFPDGRIRHARVSLHHGLLGIDTEDGVQVKGLDNLMAVGDASSLGLVTAFRKRPTGVGQLKCLVDGLQVANVLKEKRRKDNTESHSLRIISNGGEYKETHQPNFHERGIIRKINSKALISTTFGQNTNLLDEIQRWRDDLSSLGIPESLPIRMSMVLINAQERKLREGVNFKEPFLITELSVRRITERY